MRIAGQRSPLVRLRGGTKTKQLPGSDEIRPRPTRIIRQPESISGENYVIGEDHNKTMFSRAGRGSGVSALGKIVSRKFPFHNCLLSSDALTPLPRPARLNKN